MHQNGEKTYYNVNSNYRLESEGISPSVVINSGLGEISWPVKALWE
jgi:hypothetical protein